ncbi:hypothetical protein [Streptomyces guryensis]|nr:hypothetical protein [Streptomyces guryensis]
MTAHAPRPGRLPRLLAALRRARPTTDAHNAPDVWLAALRLGG